MISSEPLKPTEPLRQTQTQETEPQNKIEKIVGILLLPEGKKLYLGYDAVGHLFVTDDEVLIDVTEMDRQRGNVDSDKSKISFAEEHNIHKESNVVTVSAIVSGISQWSDIGTHIVDQLNKNVQVRSLPIGGEIDSLVKRFLETSYFPSLAFGRNSATYVTTAENGDIIVFPSLSEKRISTESKDLSLAPFFYALANQLLFKNLETLKHATNNQIGDLDFMETIESKIKELIPNKKIHIKVPEEAKNYILLDLINILVKKKTSTLAFYEKDTFEVLDTVLRNYNFKNVVDQIVDENGSFTNIDYINSLSQADNRSATSALTITKTNTVNEYSSNLPVALTPKAAVFNDIEPIDFQSSRVEQIKQLQDRIREVLPQILYSDLDNPQDPDSLFSKLRKIIDEAKKTSRDFSADFVKLEEQFSKYNCYEVFDTILDAEIGLTNNNLENYRVNRGLCYGFFSISLLITFFGSAIFLHSALNENISMVSLWLSAFIIPASMSFDYIKSSQKTLENFFENLYDWQVHIMGEIFEKIDKEDQIKIDTEFLLISDRFERIMLSTDDMSERRKDALDRFVFRRIYSIIEERSLTFDEAILLRQQILNQIYLNSLNSYTKDTKMLNSIINSVMQKFAEYEGQRISNSINKSNSSNDSRQRLSHEQRSDGGANSKPSSAIDYEKADDAQSATPKNRLL